MEATMIDCVQNSLRNFIYSNSIFMCERLCAGFPSETNLQLLAGCYLQNNQAYCAYHILKGTQMEQSRYLFAMSCFQMDLLKEAESVLCPGNDPSEEVPNGAAGQYLLGLIYRYTDRRTSAIHRFKQALSIDPLLWAAYEELCTLGSAEEAAATFCEVAAIALQKQHISHVLASHNLLTSSEDCYSVSTKSFIPAVTQSLNNLPSNVLFYTPSPVAIQLSGSFGPPPICRNLKTNGPQYSSSLGADSSSRLTVNSTILPPRRKVVDEGKLRKISGRLFSDSGSRRSSRLCGDAGSNTTTSAAGGSCDGSSQCNKFIGGRHEIFDDSRSNCNSATSTSARTGGARSLEQGEATVSIDGVYVTSSKVLNGASEILGLLATLGEGYRLSCLHRCQDALDVYVKLPLKHYHTGWVLSQVGKAYFELVDYLEADRAFSLARRVSPYSLEGMDIYSTVLYHLNEDMKLSYLAQELISTDRLAPQSWCAMGNCYSFQKDHETALKLFQRAVQLNSRFPYAHTLCGHEHVALEDYEKGIKSYRSALQIDARHYSSWYGLGMIYLRQEKFEFSEHHFRMAFQINPHSSVLMSYLGAALHLLKRSGEALEIMETAILTDKKNPLPMYQKANILVNIERYDEALEILEELKEYSPRESSVYALMGQIYKRHRMFDKAMLHFGIALDLKPSATDVATIKSAIEKLHIPDEIEDNL